MVGCLIPGAIGIAQFIIPGVTPDRVRGRLRNPVPFWIPAFAGMTSIAEMYDGLYSVVCISHMRPPVKYFGLSA
ncbi:hypothetical protein MELA_02872 [Candidatus Methylomirabilis lanthanidiphila]|uniref:Uncharacterized protein n=1 Tax=Candidatus Methylomirabilis lanthanidiphila TaxID=2211376 RepID=A0A564ZMB5_9BACT|nr:hypothetical protein MELA_02872 [Candidatus Methylomirabilis lanthanidiphila]